MRSSHSSYSMRGSGGPAGPGTRGLVVALVLVSVATMLSGRMGGPGPRELAFDADRIRHGEVWRPITSLFLEADPLSLLISGVIVWLFGSSFESMWGTRQFLRFYLLSGVFGALVAIPVGMLTNLTGLFSDAAVSMGPSAAIDAMMVALVLSAPDSTVLFGFVLPMRAKTLIGLLLGMQVVGGLMTGSSHLGMTVGGMLSGYVLVSGIWRPKLLWAKLRLWRLRRGRHLYVVPPKSRSPFH